MSLLTHLSRMKSALSISRTSSFLILVVFFIVIQILIEQSAASGQGLHCLPTSHKNNARLIWVKALLSPRKPHSRNPPISHVLTLSPSDKLNTGS